MLIRFNTATLGHKTDRAGHQHQPSFSRHHGCDDRDDIAEAIRINGTRRPSF